MLSPTTELAQTRVYPVWTEITDLQLIAISRQYAKPSWRFPHHINLAVCPNVNAKLKSKAGYAGYVWTGALLVGLLGVVSFCVQPSDEEKASKEQAGFHCLNYYSGALTDLEDAVKSNLREPSSYEHISTRVTPIRGDKTHLVVMEYRARNGFGGYEIARAAGRYANSDCKLLEWHTSTK